jgi:hypothetical protein
MIWINSYPDPPVPLGPCVGRPIKGPRQTPPSGRNGLVAQGAAAWRGRVRCTDRARSEHSGSDSVHVQYLGHAPIARVVLEASVRGPSA